MLAYDFKTGKRIWANDHRGPEAGESVPSAPIAWDGLVFVGNAGGDFKGGKGHMYRARREDWQDRLGVLFGSQSRGRHGPRTARHDAARHVDLEERARHTHQRRRNLDVIHPRPGNRAAVRPRRQSGARLRDRRARGRQSPTPTRSSCSTPRPETTSTISRLCREDWHDWDVSNPPVLIQTMGGKQLMVVAPKDGHLYGFDLADNSRLYRVPVTQVEDVAATFLARTRPSISARARWGARNGTARPTIRRPTSSSWAKSTGATR